MSTPDPASIAIVASVVPLVAWTAKTLWKTSGVVERLDERTLQHERRITRLEDDRQG